MRSINPVVSLTALLAASPALTAEIAANSKIDAVTVYPDAATKARLFTLTPMTPEQEEALTRVWTEIKTGG